MVESTGFGEMFYMMPHVWIILSSPGSGRYIEMQAGVAPTQSQTFTLGSNEHLEWTETISALQVDAQKVSGKYTDAVKAVNETVESQCNLKTFKLSFLKSLTQKSKRCFIMDLAGVLCTNLLRVENCLLD